MISPTQGVIQDISPNIVADGTILAQSGGPFTTTSLAGNYGFNLSGVSSNSSTGVTAEEDYVGQLALSAGSSNNVSGASDFSEFSSNNGVFLNIVVNGAGLSIQGDGTTATGNSNTLQLKFNTTPTSTLNFAAYIVNTNTMFVAGIDNNRVISGTLTQQTK
jgi:acetamidase/formamidase